MPTFGVTSRRENGKLLERPILDLGNLWWTTCPVRYGNAWRSSLLSLSGRAVADVKERRVTIGAYPAIRSNSGCNSEPYWGASYYCCRRVLGWLLESLSGWKRSYFNPDFNPRNFCALVNDLKWGGKLLPIIFTNIGILFWKFPNFTPK